MEQLELLYEGKAKTVFATANPEEVVMHFKDDATAFNNIKKAKIANKGILSNAISTILFRMLERAGVRTHYLETLPFLHEV